MRSSSINLVAMAYWLPWSLIYHSGKVILRMACPNPCRRQDKHWLHVAHDTWAYKSPEKLAWLLRLAALRLVK